MERRPTTEPAYYDEAGSITPEKWDYVTRRLAEPADMDVLADITAHPRYTFRKSPMRGYFDPRIELGDRPMTDKDRFAPVVEAMANALAPFVCRPVHNGDCDDISAGQSHARYVARAALTAALPLIEGLIADWIRDEGDPHEPDWTLAQVRTGQWRLP